MSESWSKEFWRLVFDLTVFWLLGLLFGYPLWGIIAGFTFHLALVVNRVRKFENWVNSRLSEPEDFGGVLEEMAYRIYRIRMRSRKRKKRMSDLLRRWQDSSGVLPDAAVVLEENDEIAWFNSTASSMLGLRPSDNGQHISNLIRSPRFISYLRMGDYTEHLEIASPIDPDKILSIRTTPYGKGQRLLLVSDVTHIQRLMTMRRDFIANVSHELRTPLTVIMGYLETLKDDDELDLDAMKSYIERIEPPATRMKSLVEDLLLLSSLDTRAPTAPDTSSTINVGSMVKNILTEAEQLSNGKHTFVLDIDEDLRLKGAEKELYSAFVNLVTNAVRYTPEGTQVTVRWVALGDGAEFSVVDNGPGISPEHLPRLTERFYRVDVGRSRQTGGTGLGLAIVKQVLRRHDAELHVTSEVGAGSEFRCTFPPARAVFYDQEKPEPKIIAS